MLLFNISIRIKIIILYHVNIECYVQLIYIYVILKYFILYHKIDICVYIFHIEKNLYFIFGDNFPFTSTIYSTFTTFTTIYRCKVSVVTFVARRRLGISKRTRVINHAGSSQSPRSTSSSSSLSSCDPTLYFSRFQQVIARHIGRAEPLR